MTVVTADQIGSVRPHATRCAWCSQECSIHAIIANGDMLCWDCSTIAQEVGDGRMAIETATVQGITYALTPPLTLTLTVCHTEDGYCWLQAKDDDPRNLFHLYGEACDDGIIEGGSRAEVLTKVAKAISSAASKRRESLAECTELVTDTEARGDAEEAAYWRRAAARAEEDLRALEARISLTPHPPAPTPNSPRNA